MESSPSSSTSPFPIPPSLSIFRLAQLYPEEKLLTEPHRWTHHHVARLGCDFQAPSVQPDATDDQAEEEFKPHVNHVKRLRSGAQDWQREIGMCSILADVDGPFVHT